jgi:hypothetical protein
VKATCLDNSGLPAESRPAFYSPNLQPSLLTHNAVAHAMTNDSALRAKTPCQPNRTQTVGWQGDSSRFS